MTSAVRIEPRSERSRGGISPLRRAVLGLLKEPGSAATVALQLGVSRQRVAYHVRELEQAGLLELVEERARRGCVERIVRVRAGVSLVGPDGVGAPMTASQDRYAADQLLALAARTVNEVTSMRERASNRNRRLVTFAIEADVGFERPTDIEHFTTRLAEEVTRLVAEFDTGLQQHRFRVVLGGYPKPSAAPSPSAHLEES